MTRLVVEAGFGSTVSTPPASVTWTDITQYVDIKDSGVAIGRGSSDELSNIQPGTCTLTLDNSDGRFSPGLSSSPYYPNVKKNTPIRVAVVTTAKNLMPNPSFEDGVSEWTSSGTPTRAVSATHVQDGTQAMLITWGGIVGQSVSTTLYGLHVGEQYTYSTYVWVPAGDAAVELRVFGAATSAASTVNGAFERLAVTWTAATTSQVINVRPNVTPTAGDEVWVDAVQVEAGSSATTFDPAGALVHDRFWGVVNDWPTKWRGLYAKASITCTDLFKRLNRQPHLRSCLTEEILQDGPIAYYPLTEPSDSVTAGDLSGVTAGPLAITTAGAGTGTLEFSSGTGPASTGEGVPQFTPTSATNGKYLSSDLGAQYEALSTSKWIHMECWFSTSVVANRAIFGLRSPDDEYQLVFSLSATGALQAEQTVFGPGGGLTVVPITAGSLANGAVHHMIYDEFANDVYVDGVAQTLGDIPLMRGLRLLSVGGYKGTRLWEGSIGHLALYVTAGTPLAATLAVHYTAGTTAFSGEDADVRIERLAEYGAIPAVTIVGSIHDPVAGQGTAGSTALAKMQEVEQTESAKLFAQRDGFGLTYQSRDVRYNPAPATEVFTIAYADLVTDDMEIKDDDQKMVNTVVASRPGGATQRVINQASIDAHGNYEQQPTLLKTTDNAVADAANWLVSRYADPEPELREVPIEAYTLAAYPDILAGDISDHFTVTGLPAEAPASEVRVTIEGYSEVIQHNRHYLQFHTSRSTTDSVWVLDDAMYSVLGTTTRLAY